MSDQPANKPEPQVVTFGCRMNTYESEVMRDHARSAGLDNAIIINTCAVTKEAERQARQTIRKLRRENPEAKIIVTGCAAQVNPEYYAGMGEVDQVLGNAEKLQPESYHHGINNPVLVDDIMEVRTTTPHLLEGFEGRTRAFVQVQQPDRGRYHRLWCRPARSAAAGADGAPPAATGPRAATPAPDLARPGGGR